MDNHFKFIVDLINAHTDEKERLELITELMAWARTEIYKTNTKFIKATDTTGLFKKNFKSK